MASTVIDSKVFGALFSTDEMRHVFSDLNLVQKWLDTEAALAKAQGEIGVIPKTQADDIVKYADAKALNIDEIGEFYKSCQTMRANMFTGALPAKISLIPVLFCRKKKHITLFCEI